MDGGGGAIGAIPQGGHRTIERSHGGILFPRSVG